MELKEWLRRRKSTSPEIDAKYGVASVGGLHYRVSWPEEYFRAADLLMKSADERQLLSRLAIPIMYLHRHALEIGMKAVIDTAHEIGARVEALDNIPNKVKPAPTGGSKAHDLEQLVPLCVDGAAAFGVEVDRKPVAFAVRTYSEIERGQSSRLRYPKVRGVDGQEPSFDGNYMIGMRAVHENFTKACLALFPIDGSTGSALEKLRDLVTAQKKRERRRGR